MIHCLLLLLFFMCGHLLEALWIQTVHQLLGVKRTPLQVVAKPDDLLCGLLSTGTSSMVHGRVQGLEYPLAVLQAHAEPSLHVPAGADDRH